MHMDTFNPLETGNTPLQDYAADSSEYLEKNKEIISRYVYK